MLNQQQINDILSGRYDQAALTDLSKKLTDMGKLIEAGFVSFRKVAMDPESPPDQIMAWREVFFAGAQHLFASIMTILEPEAEPTEKDLARMDAIQGELDAFIADYKVRHFSGEPQGRA